MDDNNRATQFRRELRDVLSHLYDPAYILPERIASAIALPTDAPMAKVRSILIGMIEGMAPHENVPADARAHRIHQVLTLRYIEHRTQEETAQQLGITVRHLAREQIKAISVLARRLQPVDPSIPPKPSEASLPRDSRANLTRHQRVQNEITSLTARNPHALANLAEALSSFAQLAAVLTEKHGIALTCAPVPEGLTSSVHPSVLQHALVAALSHLTKGTNTSAIHIAATQVANVAKITLSAIATQVPELPGGWLASEFVAAQGGTLTFEPKQDGATLAFCLPLARSGDVLVVDDNPDLVGFFELAVAGTGYHMQSVAEGRLVKEAIEQRRPDVIVLDLMLPDTNGWELLCELERDPASHGIPVIVCSVVEEEELAYALGAAACINKPVRRAELLQALDAVLDSQR